MYQQQQCEAQSILLRFLQDKEFLQKVAGCGDFASRKEFDRLWQWMYPVALALSSPQLHSTWECEDPKWIEGMISRDEAEDWLKTEGNAPQPGSFLLRFGSSRIWPHPDAGALVVSYVGEDTHVHHKLLALDGITGWVASILCDTCVYIPCLEGE
jgi:hypothetical protein